MRKAKKHGWIRIVEAFTAVLLIAGVALALLNEGYIEKEDISDNIYEFEDSVLTEIQISDSLRGDVLDPTITPPVNWSDADFPTNVIPSICLTTALC